MSTPEHPPRLATSKTTTRQLSVIVPTFNEGPNVAELVRRLEPSLVGIDAEVIFVDDSLDDTPQIIRGVIAATTLPVRLIHRDMPEGGLSGAVIAGLTEAASRLCVVMDGDLQHPPEDVPRLLERYREGGADVVIASRHVGSGTDSGLADAVRTGVSRVSTAITRAMFPLRLRGCTDPMTGFFLVDRDTIDVDSLRPRGFKILLEILARQNLRIAEIPFRFADRHAGDSKASFKQGVHFLAQLAALRFGKMSGFALIGALGAVANVAIVWALTALGTDYLWAAIIAAEVTIVGNFVLIEQFVFRQERVHAAGGWSRFAKSFTFNNVEALIRIPIMALMVESWHISSVLATAITLVVAFFARFLFHSLVVYAPAKSRRSPAKQAVLDEIDAEAQRPGEL